MNIEIILGSIGAAGTFAGSIFALIKYQIRENNKREANIMQFNANREEKMLLYFEKKNGYMERMSKDFSETMREIAKEVNNLTSEMGLMNDTIIERRVKRVKRIKQ